MARLATSEGNGSGDSDSGESKESGLEKSRDSESSSRTKESGVAGSKFGPASKGEILSWAMFDFANSSYSTCVNTAIFSAYFVKTVAGNGDFATLLLTISISVSSLLIVLTAPVIGAMADINAAKKKYLLITTGVCILCTALLATVGPGALWWGFALLVVANTMYGSGEDLIASFLPEIATKEQMGRVSAFGWTIGYIGGLSVLGLCLWCVSSAQKQGLGAEVYVPWTMLITAVSFALGSLPTFLFLKERAEPAVSEAKNLIAGSFHRLAETVSDARRYQDLFRFLISLFLFSCGTTTVVTLASVYASEVMGFSTSDNILLVLVVNITAAVGAYAFGYVQDKFGSVRTLAITLVLWGAATVLAYFATTRPVFWVVANLVGLAMGSSQSAGRALVGQLSPEGRSAEFFGLWGLVVKLATAVGPLTFGLVQMGLGKNYRGAILSTTIYFVLGLIGLFTVNEKRGRAAAHHN